MLVLVEECSTMLVCVFFFCLFLDEHLTVIFCLMCPVVLILLISKNSETRKKKITFWTFTLSLYY